MVRVIAFARACCVCIFFGTFLSQTDRATPCHPRSLSLLCNATSMPCSHTFCRDCISQAIGQKGKCPICKQESTRRNLVLNQQMTRFVTYYKQLVFNDDMGVSVSVCPLRKQLVGGLCKFCDSFPSRAPSHKSRITYPFEILSR
jgi:Zinc finger, C3HC4 type (RING finger)